MDGDGACAHTNGLILTCAFVSGSDKYCSTTEMVVTVETGERRR